MHCPDAVSGTWQDRRPRSTRLLLSRNELPDMGWRLDRIEKTVPCFDRHTLWDARSRLAELDLIAYRPWRVGEPDGSYQFLSVQRPRELPWPELQQALAQVLQHLEPPTSRY